MPGQEDLSRPPGSEGLISVPAFTSALDKYLTQRVRELYGSCKTQDKKKNIPLPFVLKFPFLTEVVRHNVTCSQYKYLTIVTDGGINPNPNVTAGGVPRDNLMVEFDDGSVWKIDGEIHNLNIESYDHLYFSNLNNSAIISAHPQNGYYNIYLIFTMEKYQNLKGFKKHNPSVCEENIIVAADSNTTRWIGINRIAVGSILAMGWLPVGYSEFVYAVRQTGASTNWTFQIWEYSVCGNLNVHYHVNVNAATCLTFNNQFSNRFLITFTNVDMVNAAVFNYQMTFLNKSDANF